MPWKSCLSMFRIKLVFPVEYSPTSNTIGFAVKSGSSKTSQVDF
jgi:hypothetical protein